MHSRFFCWLIEPISKLSWRAETSVETKWLKRCESRELKHPTLAWDSILPQKTLEEFRKGGKVSEEVRAPITSFIALCKHHVPQLIQCYIYLLQRRQAIDNRVTRCIFGQTPMIGPLKGNPKVAEEYQNNFVNSNAGNVPYAQKVLFIAHGSTRIISRTG